MVEKEEEKVGQLCPDTEKGSGLGYGRQQALI